MAWKYSNIESTALPPCPNCNKDTFVTKTVVGFGKYHCDRCRIRFDAELLEGPLKNMVGPYSDGVKPPWV